MAVVSLVEMQLELPSWVKLPVVLSTFGESNYGLDVAIEFVLEAVLSTMVIGAAKLASISNHASTLIQNKLILGLIIPLEIRPVIFENLPPIFRAEIEKQRIRVSL